MGHQRGEGVDVRKKVVILGCGPAGLLAALASRQYGAEVTIISVKEKSRIHGAQYLHRQIEGLSPRFAQVVFKKMGDKSIYAYKVYQDAERDCSWDKFEDGVYRAWSMRDAYDQLWAAFERDIIDVKITPQYLDKLEGSGYDLLISTIPARHMCEREDHTFIGKSMWVTNGNGIEFQDKGQNIIIYSGTWNNSWYRYSSLFGHSFYEFGHSRQFAVKGIKPVSHDCDCRPRWTRMGRFGKWERGVLVHNAYEGTIDALHELSPKSQAGSRA